MIHVTMDLFIAFIMAAVLGTMPVVAYYFGWLAGRPARLRHHRTLLLGYIASVVAAGSLFLGLILLVPDLRLTQWVAGLPFGILMVISPTLAIWFFFGALGGNGRRRSDECMDCGYDLRGNVSGQCPECGRLITARESSSRQAG